MNDAWQTYELLRLQGLLRLIPLVDMFVFAGKVVVHADSPSATDASSSRAQWTTRLDAILQDIRPRVPGVAPRNPHFIAWQCLMAHSLALTDRLDEALALCRGLERDAVLDSYSELYYLQAYLTMLLGVRKRHGPVDAVAFVADQWDILSRYIPSGRYSYREGMTSTVDTFRDAVWDSLKEVDNVEEFLDRSDHHKTKHWWSSAPELLMRMFCLKGFSSEAASVVKHLQGRSSELPWAELMLLIKTLARQRNFSLANSLFNAAAHDRRTRGALYHRTGLFLHSRQGDVTSAQQCFDKVFTTVDRGLGDINLLIHAHAHAEDSKGAVAVFEKYLSGQVRPNTLHFSGVILAHARSGDLPGMQDWIKRMRVAGLKPDEHIYSIILQGFADRGDEASVGQILQQMRASGLKALAHTSTSAIATLARKKDYRGAEKTFKAAVAEGVVPDRQMITAVMNAHVEAGNWRGVIKVFDYLKVAASQKQFALSAPVYNTLLKAYVLIGAPWTVIGNLYASMLETAVPPDAFTYSLLIQSACDNGTMDMAMKLYGEMQNHASEGQAHLRANVYVLTILMAGWLKQSKREKAKEVYDLMLSQGIQPSSVTFHHIIKAYSNRKSQESIDTAYSFLQELMSTTSDKPWLQNLRGVRSGLDHVYGPLVTAYTRQKDPVKVQKLMDEMAEHGGPPSLGILTALLDVHRRAGDLNGVKQTWSRIYEVASSPSVANGVLVHNRDPHRSPGTAICVPLSIYIDALSTAGEYHEIAEAWQEVLSKGFSVDSHNWTQLTIALLRAGEPWRAFEIVQKVLVPHQQRALKLRDRWTNPTSPLERDSSGSKRDMSGSGGNARDKGRRYSNIRLERRRLLYIMHKMREAPEDYARAPSLDAQDLPRVDELGQPPEDARDAARGSERSRAGRTCKVHPERWWRACAAHGAQVEGARVLSEGIPPAGVEARHESLS